MKFIAIFIWKMISFKENWVSCTQIFVIFYGRCLIMFLWKTRVMMTLFGCKDIANSVVCTIKVFILRIPVKLYFSYLSLIYFCKGKYIILWLVTENTKTECNVHTIELFKTLGLTYTTHTTNRNVKRDKNKFTMGTWECCIFSRQRI